MQGQAKKNHLLSNVSVGITVTFVCFRTECECDKNQQYMSKQWSKTGHGRDTAVDSREEKKAKEEKCRGKSDEKRWQTHRHGCTIAGRESQSVSDTSGFLHTYSRFSQITAPVSQILFCSLCPVRFPQRACQTHTEIITSYSLTVLVSAAGFKKEAQELNLSFPWSCPAVFPPLR